MYSVFGGLDEEALPADLQAVAMVRKAIEHVDQVVQENAAGLVQTHHGPETDRKMETHLADAARHGWATD